MHVLMMTEERTETGYLQLFLFIECGIIYLYFRLFN